MDKGYFIGKTFYEAGKKYVDDSVNTVSENNTFKNTQMNNMLSSLTISGSLSTGLTKSKTLGEVFPKLLNEEYGVLKQCYVTVEVDGSTKPILTENYDNVLIQLYDNDNNLISFTSVRPKKVGNIYFNANEYMQMVIWFDTTYTEESGLNRDTPGYVTSFLSISASKNTEEYINAIKDLRISVTLRYTNYLQKNNTVVYEPTGDYNPATKKYVDERTFSREVVTVNNVNDSLTLTTDKNQYATLAVPVEIILPTVTSFTELHLFFSGSEGVTIGTTNVKWESQVTIENNKSYEIIFTYVNESIGWLAKTVVYS